MASFSSLCRYTQQKINDLFEISYDWIRGLGLGCLAEATVCATITTLFACHSDVIIYLISVIGYYICLSQNVTNHGLCCFVLFCVWAFIYNLKATPFSYFAASKKANSPLHTPPLCGNKIAFEYCTL